MPAKQQYPQNYRPEWENIKDLKPWLTRDKDKKNKAYCNYCKCSVNAKLCDVKDHAKTSKHIKNAQPFAISRQPRIDNTFKKESEIHSVKEAEGKIAMYVAEHSSFNSTDHLTETVKKCSDPKIANDIKLHRSKCKGTIVNVIGPHFKQILKEDIGDSAFRKFLGMTIRYYSKELQRIVCTSLDLVEIESGTARCMAEAVIKQLKDMNLDSNNLVGIGVDNASVNTGCSAGVCEILKQKLALPHLAMVRCICHSLQLAVSHAIKGTIPKDVEYLVGETIKWFNVSSKRKYCYSELYQSLHDGDEPLMIPRVCDVRWLSIEPAVCRILDQWTPMTMHYGIVCETEHCKTAEYLSQHYNDVKNKLYLLFLRPILKDVQKVVKFFQFEKADPTKLLDELIYLIKVIWLKVAMPDADVDPLTSNIEDFLNPNVYFGRAFNETLNGSNLEVQEILDLRKNCTDFAVKLFNELKARLPDNFKILQKMSLFSPTNCLNPFKDHSTEIAEIAEIAETLGYNSSHIEVLENQWRHLNLIKWKEGEKDDKVKDAENFWIEVGNYKDASGNNPYQELHEMAMRILSLPHSNAEVERLFSQMNLIKSKLRNKLSTSSVNAVLAIRCGLKRMKSCCYSYELPPSVVKKIGTMAAYLPAQDSSNDENLSEEPDDVFYFI